MKLAETFHSMEPIRSLMSMPIYIRKLGNIFHLPLEVMLDTHQQVFISMELMLIEMSVMWIWSISSIEFWRLRFVFLFSQGNNSFNFQTFDNIWLDAEGAEYPLFDIFQKTGRLERKGIKFCQMSLEVHSPSEPQQIQFMELIKQIIKEFRYGIHKNRNVGHMRMYLFNFGDSYCVKKFLTRNLYELVAKEESDDDYDDNLILRKSNN